MSDLIDRRAAIDDLHGKDPSQIWDTADIEVWINELPSVQPDHVADVSKKVSISCAHENDLVSRKAAIEALARMMPRSYTPDGSHPADEEIFRAQEVFADCIEALEILPSAQPEIIRCKECKHRDKYGCCKYWKGLAMGDIPIATDDYDFCSYAEQKGEQCDGKL